MLKKFLLVVQKWYVNPMYSRGLKNLSFVCLSYLWKWLKWGKESLSSPSWKSFTIFLSYFSHSLLRPQFCCKWGKVFLAVLQWNKKGSSYLFCYCANNTFIGDFSAFVDISSGFLIILTIYRYNLYDCDFDKFIIYFHMVLDGNLYQRCSCRTKKYIQIMIRYNTKVQWYTSFLLSFRTSLKKRWKQAKFKITRSLIAAKTPRMLTSRSSRSFHPLALRTDVSILYKLICDQEASFFQTRFSWIYFSRAHFSQKNGG